MISRGLVVFLLMVFASGEGYGEENRITLATSYPVGSEIRSVVDAFVSRVNERVGGRYKIDVVQFEGGVPQFSSLNSKYSLYVLPAGFFSEKIYDASIFELPFLFKNHAQLEIFQEFAGPKVLSRISDTGFVALEFWNGQMNGLFGKSIYQASDMEGWRIATYAPI